MKSAAANALRRAAAAVAAAKVSTVEKICAAKIAMKEWELSPWAKDAGILIGIASFGYAVHVDHKNDINDALTVNMMKKQNENIMIGLDLLHQENDDNRKGIERIHDQNEEINKWVKGIYDKVSGDGK